MRVRRRGVLYGIEVEEASAGDAAGGEDGAAGAFFGIVGEEPGGAERNGRAG